MAGHPTIASPPPHLPTERTGTPGPHPARAAAGHLAVAYIGFSTVGDCREYSLQVREGDSLRHYTVAIPHSAFLQGRARLQDGPEICYLRVQQEMLTCRLEGPTALTISDDDLAAYRLAHSPVPRGRLGGGSPR